MDAWILFWKVIFIAALLLFAGMSVWVIIGGWVDLKKMFEDLKQNPSEEEED